MKLEKENSLKENIELYQLSDISNYNEVITYFSTKYNKIENINITEYNNDEISSDEKYDSLESLFSKRPLIDLNFKGLISFHSADNSNYLLINTIKNTVSIMTVKTNDKNNFDNKIEYYEDDYGNIIKYDKNTSTFYVLGSDGKTWIQKNSYLREYNNSDLTLIDYKDGEKRI